MHTRDEQMWGWTRRKSVLCEVQVVPVTAGLAEPLGSPPLAQGRWGAVQPFGLPNFSEGI